MEGLAFWMLGALAAFVTGLSKGGLSAFSMLAVPLLALVISPVTAAGLLLPVFLFSDIFGVWTYRHEFRRDLLRIAAVGTVLGCGIGWLTAHIVSDDLVRVIIGTIGASFALKYLLGSGADAPKQSPTWGKGVVLTTIAGFTSFVSHAGAPPWQMWVMPLKLSKLAFAGTTTIVFAVMNVTKIVPYYYLGQFSVDNLAVAGKLFVPAVLGVFVGYQLTRRLPDRVFFGFVIWALLAVSIKLIWDGVTG
ncbi:sulfite exporter TauE/SafE family protein [Pseudooctadecabacter sp.]|uniref:sulfite exporter TauE/SafE family protein n=1 Tax=Pseudooctadecabacter sp. TaxID=1966338 RepID=UPI0035C7EC9F